MKDCNSEINRFFRSRLEHAELPVREGFWDDLQRDLQLAGDTHKISFLVPNRLRLYAAVVSVLILLGSVFAVCWYCLPDKEIGEVLSNAYAIGDAKSLSDFFTLDTATPEVCPYNVLPASDHQITLLKESSSLSDRQTVMTVRIRVPVAHQESYAGEQETDVFESEDVNYINSGQDVGLQDLENSVTPLEILSEERAVESKHPRWTFKAGIGSALPYRNCTMPFTMEVLAGYRFNSRLAVESGVRSNYVHQDVPQANNIHTLGIPLQFNVGLVSLPRVNFYAIAGGMMEKTFGFDRQDENVSFAVQAGVGLQYQLNNRIAFFAEPTVSYHFDTDAGERTLHTERPTNLNFMCGIRMSY